MNEPSRHLEKRGPSHPESRAVDPVKFPIDKEEEDVKVKDGAFCTTTAELDEGGTLLIEGVWRNEAVVGGARPGAGVLILGVNHKVLWGSEIHTKGINDKSTAFTTKAVEENVQWTETIPPEIVKQARALRLHHQGNPDERLWKKRLGELIGK